MTEAILIPLMSLEMLLKKIYDSFICHGKKKVDEISVLLMIPAEVEFVTNLAVDFDFKQYA